MTTEIDSSNQGLFVSVDGPSGCGKTSTIAATRERLTKTGRTVWVTAHPSPGPAGLLARDLTETVTGPALACLYAADRYHHFDTALRPRVAAGDIVISDRYTPSGLVMQRFDSVPLSFLASINSLAPHPDIAVVLTAEPTIIEERLSRRGRHNRMQHQPGSSAREVGFYGDAIEMLRHIGYPVFILDVSVRTPTQAAHAIVERIGGVATRSDPRRP